MKKNRGQSIVELIFSIVLVGLVLTGVVSLIVKSSGGQTESGLKDKAVGLSKIVMERIVADSKNPDSGFWSRNGNEVNSESEDGYPGYLYAVNYSVDNLGDCDSSTDGRVKCIEVTVTVGWQGGSEDVTFSRFFSR